MPPDAPADRSMRDLVRHTLVYGSGYVTMAAVSLILVPVYAHHLSPSDFGLLALMLVLYGLMKQVYDLGLMNSVGRFFFDCKGPDAEEQLSRMRATSLAFLACYGGVLTALLCLLAGDWSRLVTGDDDHAGLVRVVAVLLYAEALSIVPLTVIRMQERSTFYVALTVVRFALTLVLSLLFVAVLDQGVRGALLGSALPACAVLPLLLSEYRKALARPSWELLREMLAFGLPFFPVLLGGWLIEASDRYLLELFASREDVGFYSLAYRIGAVMQLAVAAFSMGWAPLRYRIYERPDAPDVYRRLTRSYVVAATGLAVALAVWADELVAAIAPPSYAPAAGVVALIALAYVLYGLYLMMVTGMGVTKHTAPMAWIAVAGAVVNVGLNLLLIPAWGMTGAALTTVVAYGLMVAGTWWASQRVYPIPYDWPAMARIGVLAAAAVGAAAILDPEGWATGLAVGAVAWAAFAAGVLWTGAVSAAELRAARAVVG